MYRFVQHHPWKNINSHTITEIVAWCTRGEAIHLADVMPQNLIIVIVRSKSFGSKKIIPPKNFSLCCRNTCGERRITKKKRWDPIHQTSHNLKHEANWLIVLKQKRKKRRWREQKPAENLKFSVATFYLLFKFLLAANLPLCTQLVVSRVLRLMEGKHLCWGMVKNFHRYINLWGLEEEKKPCVIICVMQ